MFSAYCYIQHNIKSFIFATAQGNSNNIDTEFFAITKDADNNILYRDCRINWPQNVIKLINQTDPVKYCINHAIDQGEITVKQVFFDKYLVNKQVGEYATDIRYKSALDFFKLKEASLADIAIHFPDENLLKKIARSTENTELEQFINNALLIKRCITIKEEN